jgi:hypothetical protein
MPAQTIRSIDDRPDQELARALGHYADSHVDPAGPPQTTLGAPPAAKGAPPAAAAATWRVGASLLRLREQINAKFPGRKKDSDGTIGDTAHCPGDSDHCPNIVDAGVGVVTAMDITHDPGHGLDAGQFADMLRQNQDPRIKYIISNRRIASSYAVGSTAPFVWRLYNGDNPHDRHFHVSVNADKTGPAGYDTATDWVL